VGGLAYLAGLWLEAKATDPSSGHTGGLHVGSAGADGGERLGDPPGHELIVARRLRSLAPLDTSLAVLQEPCQDSSRGSSSVNTCGLPPLGEHL
jgi:hypothetical protein